MSSTVVPAHSAIFRRSTGWCTFTLSYSTGPTGVTSKPYRRGFRAITIAASTIGTYSRVSRGRLFRLPDSFQKSSRPYRFMARWTSPGPPL